MGTATNQIATYGDCNNLSGTTASGVDTDMCPRKTDISSAYYFSIGGTYLNDQCVKYSDLSLATPGSLTINTTPTLVITYPGDYTGTGGDTSGRFTITTGSNTSQIYFYSTAFINTTSWNANGIYLSQPGVLYSNGYISCKANTQYTVQVNYQNSSLYTKISTPVTLYMTPYNGTKAGTQVSVTIQGG